MGDVDLAAVLLFSRSTCTDHRCI